MYTCTQLASIKVFRSHRATGTEIVLSIRPFIPLSLAFIQKSVSAKHTRKSKDDTGVRQHYKDVITRSAQRHQKADPIYKCGKWANCGTFSRFSASIAIDKELSLLRQIFEFFCIIVSDSNL